MNIKPGKYWYKRPGWEEKVPVIVEKNIFGLFVRFSADSSPVKMVNIPANAQFTKRDD